MFEDTGEVGFGQQVEVVAFDLHAVGTHLDLPCRFFTADVQHRADRLGEQGADLQQQRTLPDTRFTTEQHDTTGDDTATEDTVEFFDRHKQTLAYVRTNLAQALGSGAECAGGLAAGLAGLRCADFLHRFFHRVKFATVGAAPETFGRLVAAVGTNKLRACFRHE